MRAFILGLTVPHRRGISLRSAAPGGRLDQLSGAANELETALSERLEGKDLDLFLEYIEARGGADSILAMQFLTTGFRHGKRRALERTKKKSGNPQAKRSAAYMMLWLGMTPYGGEFIVV